VVVRVRVTVRVTVCHTQSMAEERTRTRLASTCAAFCAHEPNLTEVCIWSPSDVSLPPWKYHVCASCGAYELVAGVS
jgi:hypothetical protein